MERRIAGMSSSFPCWNGAVVLLLVAVLVVVGRPGIANGSTRPGGGGQVGPALAEAWADPIGDLALDLEYDVGRIFRFVADEIRYEPYPGILRGARGTLVARAGNSVDKAVLLGALLDESQVRYRFARGPLDDATAILDSLATDLGERAGSPGIRSFAVWNRPVRPANRCDRRTPIDSLSSMARPAWSKRRAPGASTPCERA